MANTFTQVTTLGVTYWDFKVGTYTLKLNTNNASHAAVIALLSDPTEGLTYRQYLEEQVEIEKTVGVFSALTKFVYDFRETLGFSSIVEIPIPPEIDPTQP